MTPAKRVPCSDQSLARNDQMFGTASAGTSWMLLELCGAWGKSAFLQSPESIEPELGRAIVRRVEKAGMRIAAIRRPGRRPEKPRWRWFVAQSSVGGEALYCGEVSDPREYLDLALDGSGGTLCSDPMVAICAHGKHDQCCAVRGRSACKAIATNYPEYTWECSHLGGDRFAATMLVLPEGLCYGRIDSTDSADLVRLYLDGRLDNRFLRGRTSLPHVVQAAQYYAREKYGDDRIASLQPIEVEVEVGDRRTRVVLSGQAGPIEVILEHDMSEPLLSQCHASVPGRVRVFTLVSIALARADDV
jgi:hypothetical protein